MTLAPLTKNVISVRHGGQRDEKDGRQQTDEQLSGRVLCISSLPARLRASRALEDTGALLEKTEFRLCPMETGR